MPHNTCPKCFNDFVRRSHRVGLVEHLTSLFSLYPFRCQLCGYRFRLIQKGVKYKRGDEERREYDRHIVSFPAIFSMGSLCGDGTIKDISMAGCLICAEVQLDIGELLHLSLQIPTAPNSIEVEVAVLRSVYPSIARLEFIEFAESERVRLRQFIHGLISAPSSSNG